LATSPSGYFLVAVLRPANGQKLLVNRGWMPAAIAYAGAWDKPEFRAVFPSPAACCVKLQKLLSRIFSGAREKSPISATVSPPRQALCKMCVLLTLSTPPGTPPRGREQKEFHSACRWRRLKSQHAAGPLFLAFA
jgi:hypothetical protein